MFVFANLLYAVAQVLDYLLLAYFWILIGRAVVSWVRADYNNPIVRFLYAATEPVLERVRNRLPIAAVGGFDFSPIAVWLAVVFLRHFLVRTLYDLASTLR
jgi:YggT family protein